MGAFLKNTARDLIDRLIGGWCVWELNKTYYLTVLAPAIVRGATEGLTAAEQEIVDELRSELSSAEWERLPELIEARQVAVPEEAEARRRQEAERLAGEREKAEEHHRQEAERLARESAEAAALHVRGQAFVGRAWSEFDSNFLSSDQLLRGDPDRGLLSDSEYLELKAKFVQEWAERELNQPLDLQQAVSVAATGGDIQVIARAGSGKTRTLVTRALFLQKHCGVSPNELLLLAFNKAAAREMRERLEGVLKGDVPHVMTFHALAHAVVNPEDELIYDEPAAGNLGLSREIQRAIDAHLQSDKYRTLIRDLMLMHFRDDWERIVEGGFHLPIEELIEHRSALPRETLKGEYVKSFGERLIANTLFQYDIEYKYERNFRWDRVNYKPDFTVDIPGRRGVVIEYFGLKGDPDYDQMSEKKRQFWAQHNQWSFVEFSPTDIASLGAEGFAALLLKRLEEAGVPGRRLSDEELWERIRRRAIDKFTGAVRSFVSRCRTQNTSPDELRQAIVRHEPINEAERLFLVVGASIYADYLERLGANRQEDFDGLMWRAIALLAGGQSRFVRDRGRDRGDIRSLRFVLIDEFQDFSEMFYALSREVRSLSSGVEFFCVGDDWQAINGFAGSDLRFFEDFSLHFRAIATLNVNTNYRSPTQVVQLGNALMAGLGEPAVSHRSDAGWVRTACLSEFTPSPVEQARHGGDEATPAVLRLVRQILDSGRDVVMLSRRNDPPWYVRYSAELSGGLNGLERFAEHVRSFLLVADRGRVTASTAHKYKGLEKEAVIVLDADAGSYPLVHPNWVFLRIFGDSVERIEAEERRLFYVALTRSQHSLVILSDDRVRESPYLADIRLQFGLASVAWPELSPVPSLDGAQLEVRVRFPYDSALNEQLKNLRYRWDGKGKYWVRAVSADDFNMTALCQQPWARSASVRVNVYAEDGTLVAQR